MFALRLLSTVFATVFVGFGVNTILRPSSALEFFELSAPVEPAQRELVDALLAVYGVRDVFMGVAIYASAYFGSRKALGWIIMAGSAVAFADGAVRHLYSSKGEWNHWGYAPALTIVGGLLALG